MDTLDGLGDEMIKDGKCEICGSEEFRVLWSDDHCPGIVAQDLAISPGIKMCTISCAKCWFTHYSTAYLTVEMDDPQRAWNDWSHLIYDDVTKKPVRKDALAKWEKKKANKVEKDTINKILNSPNRDKILALLEKFSKED